jgi:hypothetical protein
MECIRRTVYPYQLCGYALTYYKENKRGSTREKTSNDNKLDNGLFNATI